MRSVWLGLCALVFADPAHATGGFLCRTAGGTPLEIGLTIGHVPGAPLVGSLMREGGRTVAVTAAQWWFDGKELRLHLTDRQALRSEAVVVARRTGRSFDGSVTRAGKRRWIRCRES